MDSGTSFGIEFGVQTDSPEPKQRKTLFPRRAPSPPPTTAAGGRRRSRRRTPIRFDRRSRKTRLEVPPGSRQRDSQPGPTPTKIPH
ncbi:hypothetical protein HPP92_022508 [Vanilla planifolia]|uniref:Uncharacterized protein n=1 Tax=Vanilla planifolia TaxID=51239 RepID=A0A835PSC1_VANPL|nr:hypothetical protein HPP92_022508 [Vanilla planifolia]